MTVNVQLTRVSNRAPFSALLLLGDEDPEILATYMDAGDLFVATTPTGQTVGVALIIQTGTQIELKNIAVAPTEQHKGIGRQLVQAVLTHYRGRATEVVVGTGDADVQNQLFYLRNGFRYVAVKKDFFVQYHQPIFANGVQLRDMVMLTRKI